MGISVRTRGLAALSVGLAAAAALATAWVTPADAAAPAAPAAAHEAAPAAASASGAATGSGKVVGTASSVVLPNNSSYVFVINGGYVFGNQYNPDYSRQAWGYKDGTKVFLPTPGAGWTSSIESASTSGYAVGSVSNSTDVESEAVRWSLQHPQPQRLVSDPFSFTEGMNHAGDAVVNSSPAGSGISTITVVPVKGKPTVLTGAENAFGLSAKDQTIAPYVNADQTTSWYLAGPSGRVAKLPNDPNAVGWCFLPVTDSGYVAYSDQDNNGHPYVYLRDLGGTIRRTGLTYTNCDGSGLSDAGYLTGSTADSAAVYHAGKLTLIPPPPGASVASGDVVNNEGDVVVDYTDAAGNLGLALWRAGTWILLPLPTTDAVVAQATSIDDTGQATGWYQTSDNQVGSVLWTFPAS